MIDDALLVNDWHVVARSRDVMGGGVRAARVLGRDVVLWRGRSAGDSHFAEASGLHAWRDLCVHRGAKLSGGHVAGAGDCLACPYHGWEYGADGRCVRIPSSPAQTPPAKARVETYRVTERYGFVWVCVGEPRGEVPEFAEWDDASFRKVDAGPYVFRALGPRVIENFLDVGHFPFVHAGLLGDVARPEIADYEVETREDGIEAKDIRVWQPDPDGTGRAAEVYYTYRVLRPLTAYFQKQHGAQRFSMINFVSPVDEGQSVSWAVMALNYADDASDHALREFQDRVTGQDVPVVESQRPELLPLDLQAELHLRSDRTAIAYRQWLKKIGLRYGTA